MEDRGEKSRRWQQGRRKKQTRNNQNMFVAHGLKTVHDCKHKVLFYTDQFYVFFLCMHSCTQTAH